VSGDDSYTEAGARLEFWQARQRNILSELQKWLDRGWEPVGEVGPAGIRIEIRRHYFKGWTCGTWLMYLVIGLASMGLFLLILPLLWSQTWAYPIEFRVQIRRPD
jgi:hypothetical protein